MCLYFSPFYQADEASRAQLKQPSPPSAGKELKLYKLLLMCITIKYHSKSE